TTDLTIRQRNFIFANFPEIFHTKSKADISVAKVTFASANRRASASACFGHNATALLPHCANTSAQRLTAPALTNIGERGLGCGKAGRHVKTSKHFNNVVGMLGNLRNFARFSRVIMRNRWIRI
ncbi:MAG: hypothetical protein K2L46_08175, partial [Paramuribaculum sp.]|nr:hypothetical protein [Paramuribaculum sp.]